MKIFFFLFSILTFNVFASNVDVLSIRRKFYASVDNYNIAKKFLKELQSEAKKNSPIVVGYHAALTMTMAKHTYNPYSKFKYFIDGKNMLENIIAQNEENFELRLIRFAIQTNVPSFLGYNSNVNDDKLFLLKNINTLNKNVPSDKDLIDITVKYLQDSKRCSDEEIVSLQKKQQI